MDKRCKVIIVDNGADMRQMLKVAVERVRPCWPGATGSVDATPT